MRIERTSILLLLTVLAACAHGLDARAIPRATSNQSLALERCGARAQEHAFGNMQKLAACLIAARRQFAIAIKLPQIGLFDAYEQRRMLTAKQLDDGQISLEEMQQRSAQADQDYTNVLLPILAQAQQDEERRRRVAAWAYERRPAER